MNICIKLGYPFLYKIRGINRDCLASNMLRFERSTYPVFVFESQKHNTYLLFCNLRNSKSYKIRGTTMYRILAWLIFGRKVLIEFTGTVLGDIYTVPSATEKSN